MRSLILRYLALPIIILATFTSAFAQTYTIYGNGNVVVAVPASQYINVFSEAGSTATVQKQVGGPATNQVPRYTTETNGLVTGGETSFGPYTTATNIRIFAGPGRVFYSVGALAAVLPCLQATPRPAVTQMSPATYNSTSTTLASDLMLGLVTSTQATGATITLTLPTGTLTDAASNMQINQAFDWSLINLSTSAANTVTLGAGTGHTIVGDAITQASGLSTGCSTSRWRTRKTATNTFVTYRLN